MKNSKTLFIKLIILLSFAISFMGFVVGNVASDEEFQLVAVFFIWIYLLIKNFKRSKVTVLSFILTFFVFLLGTAISSQFDTNITLKVNDHETIIHIYRSLYVALLAFDIGTIVADRVRFRINSNYGKTPINDDSRIQKASKYVFYVTAAFSLLLSSEKCAFTLITRNYTSSYISFSSVFPPIFSKLDTMRNFAFFMFLATLPNPSKAKLVFIIEFINSLILLIYGQRTSIVLTIIIVCLYCILYENAVNRSYSIIKRRWYYYAALLTPFAMIFFDYYIFYRDGRKYEFNGIFQSLKHILSSLGGSINVIGYAYDRAEDLSAETLYSLSGIINFFTKNFITRWFGAEIYAGNSIQHAIYGNELSHSLTYIVRPSSYLSGYGMGSCYIAEAYHDFGYIGVALFSFIYGVILTRASALKKGHFIRNAIITISLYSIIIAPRNSADTFLSSYFNFSFIFTLVTILLISRILSKSNEIPEV